MMTDIDVAGYAAKANEAHDACVAAATNALEHAINAGAWLLEARAAVRRSEWRTWVNANFRSPSMAANYMRLARYAHLLPADVEFTQLDALKFLRGLPSIDGAAPPSETEALRADGLRLVEAGYTLREVAEILGVGRTTVLRWTNGDERKRDAEPPEVPRVYAGTAQRRRAREPSEDERREVLSVVASMETQGSVGGVQESLALLADATTILRACVRHETDGRARSAIVDALARLTLVGQDLMTALETAEAA